jgi:hypothetical protein
MRLDPASAPSAHRAVSRTHGGCNLLIALQGMLVGSQNDAGTYGQRLRRRVGSDEVLKVPGFFSGQFNRISGFGTSHGLSPPLPSLSSRVDPVKLGKNL